MRYDDRDRSIIAQVATKAAVELVVGGHVTYAELGTTAVELQELVFTLAEATHAPVALHPTAAGHPSAHVPVAGMRPSPAVVAGDPMSVIESTFTTDAGRKPIDMSTVPPAQPISAESPSTVLWADALLHNPDDWFNNLGDSRAKSGGGKGPDYRHKSLEGKGGFKVGLWVDSKDTPPFVASFLGS